MLSPTILMKRKEPIFSVLKPKKQVEIQSLIRFGILAT